MHKKRDAVFLLWSCVILGFFSACRSAKPVSPPLEGIRNFILISIDDLRADRLGCYGNDRPVSPFLDELAAEGAVFTNVFTPYPFTPPAHASLLTSLYPTVFDIPLDTQIPTLASIFRQNGYRTAAFTGGAYMTKGYG